MKTKTLTTKQAQREATTDAPKESGRFTLYPAKYWVLEWLQSKRKNPVVIGGDIELRHVAEVCFAFTRPSIDIAKLSDAKLKEAIDEFMHDMTGDEFRRIEAHAERELLKFQKTAVGPKQQAVPAPRAKNRTK